jgi:hypothetical protein
MPGDEPAPDIIPVAPAVRPTWPEQSDAALLAGLLSREAFHLRNAIRETSGRTRKHAFARLAQVKELIRRVGGPFPDA